MKWKLKITKLTKRVKIKVKSCAKFFVTDSRSSCQYEWSKISR